MADAGFTVAAASDGGVQELADDMLIALLGPRGGGYVLHPCALRPAGDLVAALNAGGVPAERLPIYDTTAVSTLAPTLRKALTGGEVDAVLVHSPRAAQALAAVVNPWRDALPAVRVLGLSPACLVPLRTLNLSQTRAAERPSEAALLDLI